MTTFYNTRDNMIKRPGILTNVCPTKQCFYPQYLIPSAQFARSNISRCTATRSKMQEWHTGMSVPPPSEPLVNFADSKYGGYQTTGNDELGIISVGSDANKWLFLSSPEWQAELDKTPIEPCRPESRDPKSWVYMSTRDVPDEFWSQKLDFGELDHVTDIITNTANGEIIGPEKAISLFDTNDIHVDKCKKLTETLHKIYLDMEMYEWAETLETLAEKFITKKTIQECLDVSDSDSDLGDLSLLFNDDDQSP